MRQGVDAEGEEETVSNTIEFWTKTVCIRRYRSNAYLRAVNLMLCPPGALIKTNPELFTTVRKKRR